MLLRRHFQILILLLGVGAALLAPPLARAEPFIPEDSSVVLERLPFKPGDPSMRELRQQRSLLANEPGNAALAAQTARDYIKQGRAQGDPRYFGYAQAALGSWWNDPTPPPAIQVLRASLHQSNHDFKSALADLEQVLKNNPDNFNAWLTRAIILQVQGEYVAAKESCGQLGRARQALIAASCLYSVASFNGAARASYGALSNVLENARNPDSADRQWALTILADIAVRTGQVALAEQHFKNALALGPDIWLSGAYANFLLDQNRPLEVIELLKDETNVDNLLLLLALAEQAVNAPPLSKHVVMLRERFAASRLRNDMRHQREEARFTLHILHEPTLALKLARENWAVQREPEDARIFLEAALAAEDPDAAQPVLEFISASGLEDVYLEKLIKQIETLPA